MDTIVKTSGFMAGSALPCIPMTVVPHEIAHPTAQGLLQADRLRFWGEVYPQGGTARGDVDKSTGAFVPERRGGT